MNSINLEDWVIRILATENQELSCSECFDMVSAYVDAELAHQKPSEGMQQLKQHLGQCSVCREEYEMLRELVAHQSGEPIRPLL